MSRRPMAPSLFAKLKVRLLDRVLALARRPNRIDASASVSSSAQVTSSSIHGPVMIGDHATLHRAHVEGAVSIGANSSLWGPDIYVYTKTAPIEIGNYCSIARNVSVHGYFHDAARVSTHFIGRNVLGLPIEDEIVSRGATTIGHDVWIGAGVHVMSGITIGTGAIVGAGSVVSRDIPPYAIAVGTPAKTVRFRFDEDIIARLQASRWWTWSHEEIKAKADLFTSEVTQGLLDAHL